MARHPLNNKPSFVPPPTVRRSPGQTLEQSQSFCEFSKISRENQTRSRSAGSKPAVLFPGQPNSKGRGKFGLALIKKRGNTGKDVHACPCWTSISVKDQIFTQLWEKISARARLNLSKCLSLINLGFVSGQKSCTLIPPTHRQNLNTNK